MVLTWQNIDDQFLIRKIYMSFKFFVGLVGALVLSGCVSTTNNLVSGSKLDVSTQMSATVWLDPVAADKRTVFLDIRNTSDKELTVAERIKSTLEGKGYKIVSDPEQAHFWLQGNILKVEKMDKDEAKGWLEQGYGGAIVGGVVGSAFGGGNGKLATTVGGALLGAAIDSFYEDINYTMITDLQISERAKTGVNVNEANKQTLSQGTSGAKTQLSNEITDRKKYQTRIVSNASKTNLEFEDARMSLEEGLVRSISGVL